MKPRFFIYSLMLLAMPFLVSCVSSKKYKAAVAEKEELSSKNSELTSKNNELMQKTDALNQQVSQMTATNQKLNTEFKQYAKTCEENQQQLNMVATALSEEANNMMKVAEKLNEALAKFQDKGVDVYTKDGLLYVSLQDDLLYKSGSAKLGEDGKAALASLASVLNEDFPKLKVIVLGNTDDVQFKKGSDNWSLSTERANGVVRVLRDTYNVDPTRMTAAGKGKYNPVADNSTAEGRSKNRRTDIILNPDMERVWRSVQKQQ